MKMGSCQFITTTVRLLSREITQIVQEPLVMGFGYGLSLAEFMLKGIHAQYAPQAIQINGTIENLSVIAGAEVVQVYLRNYSQQVLPRVKVLCGFQKSLFLPAKSTVDFSLTVSYETLKRLNISHQMNCQLILSSKSKQPIRNKYSRSH